MSTYISKMTYYNETKSQLEQVNIRVDLLIAKEQQMETDTRQGYSEFINDLRHYRDALEIALQALDESNSNNWQGLQMEIDVAMNNINMLVREAAEKFEVIVPHHETKEDNIHVGKF